MQVLTQAKPEYMGHTVLGKTITENYKTKKRRKAGPEELMIFKNTHEAIVDEETWELAHRLKKTVRRPSYPDRPANPLTGLVYCADCGHKMTHRQPSPHKEKVYDAEIKKEVKEQKKRLQKAEKRIAELDGLIKKLYEGNATGRIPDKHFDRMLAEYDREQSDLEQEVSELQQAITTQA